MKIVQFGRVYKDTESGPLECTSEICKISTINLGVRAMKFLRDFAWFCNPSVSFVEKFTRWFRDSLQFVINDSLSNQAINYHSWIDSKLKEAEKQYYSLSPSANIVGTDLLEWD